MKVEGFVIHLGRAEKRGPQVERIVAASPVPMHVLPAVDGLQLTEEERGRHVPELHRPRYPFELNPPEIGCFLSHRKAWAAILDRGLDAGLVVEDDVEIDGRTLNAGLVLACREVGRLGIVQFQVRDIARPGPVVARDGATTVHRPAVTPLRASCALYSSAAAARLLDLTDRFDRPVDTFIQMHWVTGVQPGIVVPSGVQEISAQVGGTTIQSPSGKRRGSLGDRLRREALRFVYRRRVALLSRRGAPLAEPDSLD